MTTENEIIEMGAELPRDAIRAMEAACGFRRIKTHRPWVVERKDPGEASGSQKELASIAETADDLTCAVHKNGTLDDLTVFRVDGEEVISLRTGDSSPLPCETKVEYAGRNIMARPDIAYAAMTRDHVKDVAKNGTRFHHLAGSIDGIRSEWWRMAVRCRATGFVLTHTLPDRRWRA